MDEALKTQLTELGLDDEQIGKLKTEGAKQASDVSLLTADQIRTITGCGTIVSIKIANTFAPAPPVEDAVVSERMSMDLLPSVPDDTAYLEMLKVGGVLKIETANVISAMRAGIADRVGLFDLPKRLLERMETVANELEEPVGENFYKLQKLISERNYADVLSAIGVPGSFVNNRRKNEVIRRLNTELWPALHDFNTQLTSWVETWATGVSNPMAILSMMAVNSAGGRGVMPPGIMSPPDPAGLRDEAEAVIQRINKVFAGTGIPVARALAQDAIRIKEVLDEPTLPAATGFTSRDLMLKGLGFNVGADLVRLERNATRFALAIMELPKVSVGDAEFGYLSAMIQVGAQIPWEKLENLGGTTRPGRPASSRISTGRETGYTGGTFPEDDSDLDR